MLQLCLGTSSVFMPRQDRNKNTCRFGNVVLGQVTLSWWGSHRLDCTMLCLNTFFYKFSLVDGSPTRITLPGPGQRYHIYMCFVTILPGHKHTPCAQA